MLSLLYSYIELRLRAVTDSRLGNTVWFFSHLHIRTHIYFYIVIVEHCIRIC